MHRRQLLQLLARYRTPYIEEAGMVARARRFVAQHPDCFNRELMHGHVSGSAWVINPARDRVLLLHHRKLERWLQPGGHADGEADIHRVVMQETAEESGVDIAHIRLLDEAIFDVDVHVVHESEHDPRHTHFDIRLLLEIDDRLPLPGNDESHQVAWVPLHQVSRFNNALSLHRMVDKTRRLLRSGTCLPCISRDHS